MAEDRAQYNLVTENELLRQHQRLLIDLARYAAEAHDVQNFLDDVMVRISAALEIDHVKLLRYRAAQADLFMEAGIGWRAGAVRATAFAADWSSPPGRAFQTGQPVVIPDVSEAPEFRISTLLREHNIVSLLNVPIRTDGAAWGVLEVDSTLLRGFSEDSQRFLTAVAALIGLVLRRADAEQAQLQAMAATAQEIQKREMLLREMQHRVKNNFQMILAMIGLNLPNFADERGREIASKIADGVMAMALAHNQLSPTQQGESVELGGYLRALAANFEPSLGNVAIEVRSDEVTVTIEQAVPIGLIVNEAVTNSVKHAFGPEGGEIRIELKAASGPGLAMLTIADDGAGMRSQKPGGSGLRLKRALADQLGGKLEQDSSEAGTTTRLTFSPRMA